MDNNLMESMKGKSREERKQIFDAYKQSLVDGDLKKVNGGAAQGDVENPTSTCPYGGNWVTSFGYVCRGIREC